MKYEIVELTEKTVVGLCAQTSNNDPDMNKIIGGLWEKLYQGGTHSDVKNRANEYAIGLYNDYANDAYTVTVGHEVTKADNPAYCTKMIPGGKYAKFEIHGDMVKAVAAAWGEIWGMDLDRSFTGDFEEYVTMGMENADINIYIALQ